MPDERNIDPVDAARQNVKLLRLSRNPPMQQKELADRIGVHPDSLSGALKNRPFGDAMQAAIAQVFGITLDDLRNPDLLKTGKGAFVVRENGPPYDTDLASQMDQRTTENLVDTLWRLQPASRARILDKWTEAVRAVIAEDRNAEQPEGDTTDRAAGKKPAGKKILVMARKVS